MADLPTRCDDCAHHGSCPRESVRATVPGWRDKAEDCDARASRPVVKVITLEVVPDGKGGFYLPLADGKLQTIDALMRKFREAWPEAKEWSVTLHVKEWQMADAENKLYLHPDTLAAYEKAVAQPRVCLECGSRILGGDVHVKAWPNTRGIKCLILMDLLAPAQADCGACLLEAHGGEVNPDRGGTKHVCGKGNAPAPARPAN